MRLGKLSTTRLEFLGFLLLVALGADWLHGSHLLGEFALHTDDGGLLAFWR
jgi:hypothetical protein